MLEARMVWSVGNSTFFNLRPGILLFKRCGLGNNAMCLRLLLHLLRTRQIKQVLGHKAPPPPPGNSSGDNTATRAAQPQRDSLSGLHTALQEKEGTAAGSHSPVTGDGCFPGHYNQAIGDMNMTWLQSPFQSTCSGKNEVELHSLAENCLRCSLK